MLFRSQRIPFNTFIHTCTQFVDVVEGEDEDFILSVVIRKGSGDNLREATTTSIVRLLPEDVVRGEA